MKEIKTVGVVGFGVMGAAIGLRAAMSGYHVIYKEISDELVKTMFEKNVVVGLKKRLDKGKLSKEEMDQIVSRFSGTSRYEDLKPCDLIIEAAVEKMDLKIDIFKVLSGVCEKDTIFASNTSTFLIEKLMEKVDNPERTAGLHYFFPAHVNRLVEVIRHKKTSDKTYQALMQFSEKNQKVPISVKDFPGFAINPIFIASYVILDSFISDQFNAISLEDISKEALNLKFGIMWVQNGSGLGTCYHAAESMSQYLKESTSGYPLCAPQLKAQFESGKPWDIENGIIVDEPAARKRVRDRLLGGIFSITSHLVEQNVVSVKDLELGVRTSLAWPKGPFGLMNALGMEETKRLIDVSVDGNDFKLPEKFKGKYPEPWNV